MRTAARNRLHPQLRCLGVLLEIDGGYGVRQPLAVRRDGGIAQPLHLHHVFEGHGALGLCGLGSLLQNSIETAKSVRARLQSCRKSNKIMLGFSPCGFVFSNLQFRSG
jgi:hypothetical protein